MEIHSLKVILTDADLNTIVRRFLPSEAPVKNLQMVVGEGAMYLTGGYPRLMMNIPFSTTWLPSIEGERFRLTLTATSIVGLPASFLRGVFLDGFRKATTQFVGLRVEEDGLLIDLDQLLTSRQIALRIRLKSVRCETGRMTIEA